MSSIRFTRVCLAAAVILAAIGVRAQDVALGGAADAARAFGFESATRAFSGLKNFTGGQALGSSLGNLDGVGALADGAQIACGFAGVGPARALGGALIGQGCHDLVELGAMLMPTPPDPRRDIEAVMARNGLDWNDFPADLRGAPPARQLEYQIGVFQEVVRRDQARMRALGEAGLPNNFLLNQIAVMEGQLAAATRQAGVAPEVAAPAPAANVNPNSQRFRSDVWSNQAGSEGQVAGICGVSDGSRGFCVEVGCIPDSEAKYLALTMEDRLFLGDAEMVSISISGNRWAKVRMQGMDGTSVLALRPDAQSAADLLARLKRGTRLSFQMDDSWGREVMAVGLRGSAAAIGQVEASCAPPAEAGGQCDESAIQQFMINNCLSLNGRNAASPGYQQCVADLYRSVGC